MLPDRTQKYGFAIGVVIIVLYLCPFFILGQDSYVTIHDNLDSLLALRTVLVQSGKVFQTNSPIEQIMNGLPRECLHSALDVVGWLFLFFRPLTAYVINTLIVRIVAFVGMFLLLRTHFIKDKNAYMIISGTSLCFALLPFYSMFGLSIAGQPLLLYAFLNLLGKEKRFSDFVIILFFPFYSSLVGAGVFILFALGILFIYDYFKNKRINYRFLVGLFVLAATYAVVEYNLVYLTFFNDGFVSHRSELDLAQHSWDLKNAVKVGLVNFLFGQYHAISLHTFILVASLLTAVFCLCKNRLKQNNTRLLIVLLGASLVISLFYGLYNWAGLIPLKEKLPILAAFQFERFHWLHPFLWYLIFALTLAVICKGKHGKRIVILLIVLQLLYSQVIQPFFSQRLGVFHSQVMANETRMNVKVIASIMSGRKAGYISYSRFFSKGLFREIGEFIGLDKKNYRVVSIGVFPSIAQYNGFYTLDSYQFNYPIEYKHKFRRIIEKELGKSEKWRRNFDEWGSRCYVFVAELEDEGFLIGKDRDVKVEKLELNTAALKEMGGEYVFSAVEILNANDTGLTLLKVFEREDSPWRIYLYSVD